MRVELPSWMKGWGNKRYNVAFGGRGSSKSYSLCLSLLLKMRKRQTRVLACREIQTSIKSSVYQLLVDQIYKYGWERDFKVTGTQIRNVTNGSVITFAGLKNNPESVKSTEGLNLCFIEEAQTISESSMRLIIPTVRKPGSQIWMAMNPRYADDYCYSRFIQGDNDNVFKVQVNYADNPWFPDVLRAEMEYDKKLDYGMYMHIWEGSLKPHGERPLFYPGVLEIWDKEEPRGAKIAGLDLSYGGNNAFVRISINEDGSELFIHEARVKSHIPLQKMAEWLGPVDITIVYDSARPEVGRLLSDQGYTTRKSKKGAGSIIRGADKMAKFQKVWFTSDSILALEEFSRLGWDKNDDIIGIRDIWDATRYAMERILGEMKVIPWRLLSA